jgi:hypothetical protein
MKPTSTTKYVTVHNAPKTDRSWRERFSRPIQDLERIKLWVEILGLLAVLSTLGVYVWLAFLQKNANTINSRAVQTAQESIQVAEQSVTVAKDTEQRELRAYLRVSVSSMNVGDPDCAGSTYSVDYVITNDGQTPAHDVRSGAGFAFVTYPVNIQADFSEMAKPRGVTFDYLSSHDSKHRQAALFPDTLSPQQLDAIRRDAARVFLVGEVSYKDIFEIERHLRFGMTLQAKGLADALQLGPPTPRSIPATTFFEKGFNFEF